MQAQICSDDFVLRHVSNEVSKTEFLMDAIIELEDTHVCFTLLRSYAGS